ncbi:hypothetical protein S83_012181, partial [Arachis hypogaea]
RKKIRKGENRKKKRIREETGRKERTTPAKDSPHRPSSLRALTVALASPSCTHRRHLASSSRVLTVAAQHCRRRSASNRGFYYMNGFSFLVAEKQSQTTYNNSQSQVTEFKKSLKAVNSACEE